MFLSPGLSPRQFRLHGLTGDRAARTTIRNISCRIQPPGRDVWSHVLPLLNIEYVPQTIIQAGNPGSHTLVQPIRFRPIRPGTRLPIGWMLRQLPEVADDVFAASWGHSFEVHAPMLNITPPGNSGGNGTAFLRLRHGHRTAIREMIQRREGVELRSFVRGTERMDIVDYRCDRLDVARMPFRRADVFGQTYIDFTPTRTILSELLVYLVALFALSDAVRYTDRWKSLLDARVSESILIDRFLDIATRKLPNLVLNQLHRDCYLFTATLR